MLEISQARVSYGQVPVLRGVSLRCALGRMTALVGPNGCGKSTLLRAVMGFVPLAGGQIRLQGQPLADMRRQDLARRIAWLPQESHCPDYMSLGELIELAGYARYSLFGGPSDRDRALFRHALETVGLSDLVRRPVNALSGGQRQRAFIALALAQDADLLLMDEPVNHLDMKYQYGVMRLVRHLTRDHGKTVVVVLHDLNLASGFADDMVMMAAGEVIASGPVAEVMRAETVARVFDIGAEVFDHGSRRICLPLAEGGV